MVSPYVIRMTTRQVSSVGDRAGQLYAVSTVGSFLGTIFTAFYGILWMGTDHLLWAEGTGLVLVGALVLAVSRLGRRGPP